MPDQPVICFMLMLLCSHLLCDFPLQSDRMVQDKKRMKFKAFFSHAALHGAAAYIICGIFAAQAWYLFVTAFLSHFLLDYLKQFISNRQEALIPLQERYPAWAALDDALPRRKMKTRVGRWTASPLFLFALDQLLHLLILAVLIRFVLAHDISLLSIPNYWASLKLPAGSISRGLTSICGFMLSIWTGGIVIAMAVKPFQARLKKEIPAGGPLIGQLERLLIFFFVLTSQLTAVGFLLTAKSILRFSEVKTLEDQALVEYVLVGTLLSLAWALLCAYGTQCLLGRL